MGADVAPPDSADAANLAVLAESGGAQVMPDEKSGGGIFVTIILLGIYRE